MGVNYDELVQRLIAIGNALVDRGNKDLANVVFGAVDAIESLQRDANRYRWLRDVGSDSEMFMDLMAMDSDVFDRFVDEAMRESNRP